MAAIFTIIAIILLLFTIISNSEGVTFSKSNPPSEFHNYLRLFYIIIQKHENNSK